MTTADGKITGRVNLVHQIDVLDVFLGNYPHLVCSSVCKGGLGTGNTRVSSSMVD